MASPLFRKSILALAVLAAPHAIAETFHLTGNPTSISINWLTNLTITGEASGTTSALSLSSYFGSPPIGNITNSANLSTTAENSNSLRIESHLGLFEADSLTNTGDIRSTGGNSSAIYAGGPFLGLAGVQINGVFSNSGNLESAGNFSAAVRLETFISLSGIVNTGTLNVSGEKSSGLICISLCGVLGKLENQGTIISKGSESSAINFSKATLLGASLINSGTLQSSGSNSTAVILGPEAGLFNQHSGRILASGIGSQAVHFTGAASDEQAHISQSGLISAEGSESIALYLETP